MQKELGVTMLVFKMALIKVPFNYTRNFDYTRNFAQVFY